MEEFDTSKCRGKLEKMGVLCTHSPKSPGPFPKLPVKYWPKCRGKLEKNKKNSQKKDQADPIQASTRGRWATANCRPAPSQQPRQGRPTPFKLLFLVLPFIFCASGQLLLVGFQHMPALPRVHLKTSNTHNFWTVASKIMKFVLMRSFIPRCIFTKSFKNLKIVWDHTTQPRIGLSLVGRSGPLGVNDKLNYFD
jgi:hypothetical protein